MRETESSALVLERELELVFRFLLVENGEIVLRSGISKTGALISTRLRLLAIAFDMIIV